MRINLKWFIHAWSYKSNNLALEVSTHGLCQKSGRDMCGFSGMYGLCSKLGVINCVFN